MSWNAFAELLAFASSALLLWPAIALNKHLRDVHEAETAFARTNDAIFQSFGQNASPTLTKAKVPNWSKRDQRLLVAGVVAFGVSSLIKLLLALGVLR